MWVTKIRIEYSSDGVEWEKLHNPEAESKTLEDDELYWFKANED